MSQKIKNGSAYQIGSLRIGLNVAGLLSVVSIISLLILSLTSHLLSFESFILSILASTAFWIGYQVTIRDVNKSLMAWCLILLYFGYNIKALYLLSAYCLELKMLLPQPIRNGFQPSDFSITFNTGCITIILVSLLFSTNIISMGHKRNIDVPQLQSTFLQKAIIFTCLFIVTTTIFRAVLPDGNFFSSVNYVANHRLVPFLLSLFFMYFIGIGDRQAARKTLLMWLIIGLIQFELFHSKSYIFLPIIILIFGAIAHRQRIVYFHEALFIIVCVFFIYPFLNVYRAANFSLINDASGFWDLVRDVNDAKAIATVTYAYSGIGSYFIWLIQALNPILGRFVGIEWFLAIVHTDTIGLLRPDAGFLYNISNIRQIMQVDVTHHGEGIGIAPSLLGYCYLVTRSFASAVVMAVGVILGIYVFYKYSVNLFTQLRIPLQGPFAILTFTILTDGNIFVLYWDFPMLVLIIIGAAFFFQRTSIYD